MLGKNSLPAKLSRLVDTALPTLENDERDVLVKTVLELRQIGAHGRSFSESLLPKEYPAAAALVSACVLFDLKTCGLDPYADTNRGIAAATTAKFAIAELVRLNKDVMVR